MKTIHLIIMAIGFALAVALEIATPITLAIPSVTCDPWTFAALLILSHGVCFSHLFRRTEQFEVINTLDVVWLTMLYTVTVIDIVLLICRQ